MNYNIIELDLNMIDINNIEVDSELGRKNDLYQIDNTNLFLWNNKTKNRDFINIFPKDAIKQIKFNKDDYKIIFKHFIKRKQVTDIFSYMTNEEMEDHEIFNELNDLFYKVDNNEIKGKEIKIAIYKFNEIVDTINIDKIPLTIKLPAMDWYVKFKLFDDMFSYYHRDTLTLMKDKWQNQNTVINASFIMYSKILKLLGKIEIKKETNYTMIKTKWKFKY